MKVSRQKLDSLLGKTRLSQDGLDLYGKCPKCDHDEFGISLVQENHPFNCFRKKKCGWSGNIFDLMRFKGVYTMDRDIDIFGRLGEEHEAEDWNIPISAEPPRWKRLKANSYCESRGFTKDDFERYEVGASILSRNFITFLVRVEGEIRGYVSRHTKHKEYSNSVTDFGKLLYGIDDVPQGAENVIVVEGIFDAIAVNRLLGLVPGGVWTCVATFGGKLSEGQLRLLRAKEVQNIYVLFESDIMDKTKHVIANASVDFNTYGGILPDEKDPATMTATELLLVLENSVNFIEYNLNYVRSNLG